MADFVTSLARVLKWEGGFSLVKEDKGNYNSKKQLVGTNYGIAAFVYERWLGRVPTKHDVRNMSKNEAAQIYKGLFWVGIQGDEIKSQAVADILFDGHVNHGAFGIRLMQRILGVKVDGKVGPITLAAINAHDPESLYLQYRNTRRDFYEQIVKRSPDQAVFLKGWLRRINSFQDEFPRADIVADMIPPPQPPAASDPPGS
jgi:lysozyme family protein